MLNGIPQSDWFTFDPSDVDRLFAQDELIARGWAQGFNVSTAPRSNDELALEVVALRNAMLLPLCDVFLGFIGGEWRRACEEVSTRMLPEPVRWASLPTMSAATKRQDVREGSLERL